MIRPHSLRQIARNLALGVATVVVILPTAPADTRPVSGPEEVKRLPAEAAQLYRDTTLFPRPMKYRDIPWLLDLDKGIGLARQENRPVLIWTSGDDPLERC